MLPALPDDPAISAAPALLDERGAALVASFLRMRGWKAHESRPVQVLFRPGRSCVVRYRVRASNPAGQRRVLTLCGETHAGEAGVLDPPDDFETRYGLADPVEATVPYLVWAYPYDPALKGLTDAAWAPAARSALGAAGPRPLAVEVQPVAYRPRRRAVFRYLGLYGRQAAGRRRVVYAKTLRTRPARRTAGLARCLRASETEGVKLSLPEALHAGNTLLFPRQRGLSLRTMLLSERTLPDPIRVTSAVDAIAALGQRLPDDVLHGRSSAGATAAFTAGLLGAIVPECRPSVDRVVAAVEQGSADESRTPVVVHGDLYEAQIFVDGHVLGFVDIDGVGRGDAGLDYANFCAHLLALALWAPAYKRRLLAYREVARRRFVDHLDMTARQFAWREALAMLQLATGPFRTLHEQWPGRVAERIGLATELLSPRT